MACGAVRLRARGTLWLKAAALVAADVLWRGTFGPPRRERGSACVRGHGIHGDDRTVRRHVELMWNDLKRGHYIDERTRALHMLMPARSNHLGVQSSINLMLQLTSTAGVIPSFDILIATDWSQSPEKYQRFLYSFFVMMPLFI